MTEKDKIINFINKISLTNITKKEENLIEETINNFMKNKNLIKLFTHTDLNYIKNCKFNDFSSKTIEIFLYRIDTNQREIDIVTFIYRILNNEIKL